MKVTHIITPINYGGGENLILNLINEMGDRVDNSVLNLAYSREFEKHLDENRIKHKRVSDKDLGASPKKSEYLIFLVLNLFRVFFISSKVQGDIVHAHGFPANMFVALMKKIGLLKGKKLIFTSHSEKKGEKEIIRKIYLFFLKEYHSITCVGEKSFDSMKKEFPELTSKITQINNGIKMGSFYYKTKDEGLKGSLGYEAHDLIAIFVSRLSHVKNHKFLLELMKEIKIPNFKLLLIGEGQEKEDLERSIKEYDLENRVKLLGYMKNEELVNYYSISDMVLFPSTSEGFGISLVEGLACKKPLVLFKNVYFVELQDGVLVAENDRDFVEKTKLLIENESARRELAEKGQAVVESLSIGNCAKNYENLYRSLYGKNFNS